MLVFLLFMAYKSNITTGVNLLATIIYQGPVSHACYLLVWISRESEGLLFSDVSVDRLSPEDDEWLPAVAAELIPCSKKELARAGARRPRGSQARAVQVLLTADGDGSGRPSAATPA